MLDQLADGRFLVSRANEETSGLPPEERIVEAIRHRARSWV